ncbi:hypothetical protein SPACI_052360 [Sporomusa acidovorans DSM 3132]|uniref:HAMP domain-containing protein n=1 Tax=Sporomusa acidovorans (strain ATCC 49682 / DSM 3132 / Mol) TaxID=1123286 RepID=A0ABZ3JAJ7_SPOA4|nr:methyl-accepting chemotaxis protein McpB [Sporomusa acidovorans DSM 3132]SDD56406.1 HAMP domain-containing protein [Sporomusa acidovorans]
MIALLSLGIISYSDYHYLLKANEDMTGMYTDMLLPIAALNENRSYVKAIQADLLELVITADDKRNRELKADIDNLAEKFNANLSEYEKTKLDSFEVENLNKLKTLLQAYRQDRGGLIQLAMQNRKTEAYEVYRQQVVPQLDAFNQQLLALAEYNTKRADQINNQNDVDFEHAKRWMLGIQLVACLLLMLTGFYISRLIINPINVLLAFSRELSTGDFRDKPRSFASRDEFGQLADSLADMRSSVRGMMKQVSESAEQVAAASEELTASADQSAQAAGQIAGSITDVAKGSEEQLNSVNEPLR